MQPLVLGFPLTHVRSLACINGAGQNAELFFDTGFSFPMTASVLDRSRQGWDITTIKLLMRSLR